jgi:putative chitinase
MIEITAEQVRAIAPRMVLPYETALRRPDFNEMLRRQRINESPLRLAHFFAQILHESGGLRILSEDLHYRSAERIRAVFGVRRFPTLQSAEPYVGQPERLAEKVYGGRKDLGNTLPGDGWAFRGRGPIQLTGRANYEKWGRVFAVDLAARPERVLEPELALGIPMGFWASRGCSEAADHDDLVKVTKLVNGGTNGLEDRRLWLVKTKAMVGVTTK